MTEVVLRAHVWLVATLLPLLVRVLPLKALLRLTTPPARLRPYGRVAADRIVAAVDGRLRNPRNMRRRACLRHGLTLYHFLRLAGVPAVLEFGVYPPELDPGRMHAHCWVTVDGVAVSAPPGQPAAVVLRHGPRLEADDGTKGTCRIGREV
jgi:hypothetical protein